MKSSVAGRIEKYSEPEPMSGCVIWTGCLSKQGYAMLGVDGKNVRVHRFVWESKHGPIPLGFVPDHTCRVRSCINDAHLEIVTERENILRGVGQAALNAEKTHCHAGHPLVGDNVRLRKCAPRGWGRVCRTCDAIKARARRQRVTEKTRP